MFYYMFTVGTQKDVNINVNIYLQIPFINNLIFITYTKMLFLLRVTSVTSIIVLF